MSLTNLLSLRRAALPLIAACTLSAAPGAGEAAQSDTTQAFQELFAQSQKDKRGLTFFVKGQSIPGIVTKVIGNEAVEVRSQTHNRVIIRIDSIDAVAGY
ncbi:MAG TPA: hypothetical protein VED01_00715 [Burkholderiales bacterium]|nr:hypothetical protein [Burkholderiales bacterium]